MRFSRGSAVGMLTSKHYGRILPAEVQMHSPAVMCSLAHLERNRQFMKSRVFHNNFDLHSLQCQEFSARTWFYTLRIDFFRMGEAADHGQEGRLHFFQHHSFLTEIPKAYPRKQIHPQFVESVFHAPYSARNAPSRSDDAFFCRTCFPLCSCSSVQIYSYFRGQTR